MQWLKTCLSLFLSFAILLVGSAAAASSVHKRCLMPSEQIQTMQMELSEVRGMMHTDCMKTEVKVKKDVHDPSCMSEQDCIMSFAKIAYANTAQDRLHPKWLRHQYIKALVKLKKSQLKTLPFHIRRFLSWVGGL
ncbi:hypothetical protein [Acinetobacter pittii]|uniref:hypothetical protein n=2 Tax=Acinetobacter TaxID=469 RepID=UPI00227B2222